MARSSERSVRPTFEDLCKRARDNTDFEAIEQGIINHPEWLTQVPNGRKWGIIHQIVYHGNVDQLNRLLVLQRQNPNFLLLLRAGDNQTVFDIAREQRRKNETMFQRIERLAMMDDLLNNAKNKNWKACQLTLNKMPDIVNEKPPYRRFYFVHQIAYVGDQNAFDDFYQKYPLNLNLLTNDDKSIVDIANGAGHRDFAEYVNGLKEKHQPRESADRFSRESRFEERAHARDFIKGSTSSGLATSPVQNDNTPTIIPPVESNLMNTLTCPLSGKILKVPGMNDKISRLEDCKQPIFF